MSAINVAVFIPGIMGSCLTHVAADGRCTEIWPGSPLELVLPYAHFEKLADMAVDSVRAVDVIRSASVLDVYGGFLDYLGSIGYGGPGSPSRLHVFPYDWRLDNARSAHRLAEKLGTIVSDAAGEVRIHLIAHSMGGLVCRYFLEADEFSAHPARPCVANLITLGTPHRGSPFALSAAVGQEKKLFLSAEQVARLANNPAFAAVYQLLPVDEPFAWRKGHASIPVSFAVLANEVNLQPENVASAVRFHQQLDIKRRPEQARYMFFYGTREGTPTATMVERALDDSATSVWHAHQAGAGDGTVPVWSAQMSGIQGFPIGGEHSTLFRDRRFRTLLEDIIPVKRILAPPPVEPTLTVIDRVVAPGVADQAVLELPRAVSALTGKLHIVALDIDPASGKVTGEREPDPAKPFTYTGAPIDLLRFQFAAPVARGMYFVRAVLDASRFAAEAGTRMCQDSLIVQES